MITRRDGVSPLRFTVDGFSIVPTFNSRREANGFARENVPVDLEYVITEVAIGRA
ncbi:hypothetical protein POP15_264 [Pectobacterium phage POP15]|nr:hypothetical protein POP15_264 [Pectobacterium phage POP15]